MDLREKIGQLIIVGFHGAFPEDDGVKLLSEQIKASKVGGVIAYGYNIGDPDQITALNKFFLAAAAESEMPPLFTTVDQEGGQVQRLLPKKGFHGFPSAEEVASMADEDVKKVYAHMADELQTCGFNWDFAPSVDMNPADYKCPILGDLQRVYGGDTKTIVHYAGLMVETFHEAGLLNCIKHFPGHGSAKKDSHQGFVNVTGLWHEEEMEPFFKLARKGKVDAVMTAHIYNEKLDPEYPATLSVRTLKKLRDHGYEGVIISDDLHMSAIQEKFSFEEAAVGALKAGNDMVIYSNNPMAASTIEGFQPDPHLPDRFLEVVLQAIADKELDARMIDQAFDRVMALKNKLKNA